MNESGRTVRLLVDHSLGGAAVIAAAHALDSVRAVPSVGAPYEPDTSSTITTRSSNGSSPTGRRRSYDTLDNTRF